MTLTIVTSPPAINIPPKVELPVIASISNKREFAARRPFANIGIAALLHLRPSLIAMVKAWLDLGAFPEHILLAFKTYRYPEGDHVREELRELGVTLVPVAGIESALKSFRRKLGKKRFIVVEDGGHILPHVFDDPKLIGGIEQTTKGTRRLQAAIDRFGKPHLNLPASRFKQRFEPDHVADAAVESIARLLSGHTSLDTLSVAVIGAAGTIGSRVAASLAPRVRELVIYDCKEPRDFRLTSFRRLRVASSSHEAISGRDLIVGCTGECTLRATDLAVLKDGVLLASTGSERTEFPVALLDGLSAKRESFWPNLALHGGAPSGTIYELKPNGKKVILLNDGEPVNFSQGAPSEPAVFDLVMGAILAGSVELALGMYSDQAGFLDVFDAIVERHALDELFLALHSNLEK